MKRKGYIAENDVAALLKRYDSSTILSLLYEISRSATSAKLNWEILVRDTNTGIKSPREYQALWRHLAYRKELDPSEADDLPLEDDSSDLEFELEPFPSISADTAAEASNYVKTLMGFPSDVSANPDTAERKKRKLWSAQEDEELAAGVDKYGEGNWSSILKNIFKHDRTASQLAQRWGLIKKRRDTGSPGTPPEAEPSKKPDILAVPKIEQVKPAIVKPDAGADNMMQQRKATFQQPSGPRTSSLNLFSTAKAVNPKAVTAPPLPQARSTGPDPMVQAAAVAAGARIAPASAAASLLKAAQTKNMVHIRPSNTTSPSTSTKACVSNSSNSNVNYTSTGSRAASSPVVHYIRTGSGAPPPMLSSLSKRPLKQGIASPAAAAAATTTPVTATAATAPAFSKGSTSKMVTVVNKCGTLGSSSNSSNPRLAIRNSKDGSIQEIMETRSLKKKVIVATESNGLVRVNPWCEGEEPLGGKAVVDIDSEDNEDAVAPTSAHTPPMSQSSGQSD